jgi:hypothetical protein
VWTRETDGPGDGHRTRVDHAPAATVGQRLRECCARGAGGPPPPRGASNARHSGMSASVPAVVTTLHPRVRIEMAAAPPRPDVARAPPAHPCEAAHGHRSP